MALKRGLRDLVGDHRPELLVETGCGPLTAAILIGQTASGRRDRHRLHRGGNRQLNRALHVIAITRGRIDPTTRTYLARKEAEGKSRIEVMRCLKRHYHRLLANPPSARSEQAPTSTPGRIARESARLCS